MVLPAAVFAGKEAESDVPLLVPFDVVCMNVIGVFGCTVT